MTYNHLRSILSSRKDHIEIETPTNSFFLVDDRIDPYVPPTFSKIEYPTENPSIVLVSAMGASGKTMTAQALAFDTKIPMLDLAKHDAVGDRTLTGVLTDAYPTAKIGDVLAGLHQGTCAVIVDGIDEARSKINEQAFEAFLNDIIRLSSNSIGPAIVILGRSQVLLSVWCYLVDHHAAVGLIEIDQFDLPHARQYIDAYARPRDTSGQQHGYETARDHVLGKLGAAFRDQEDTTPGAFLSFIGYPPVLDAIATLLKEEPNYFRIQQALSAEHTGRLESDLLIRISDYLLDREKRDKAIPNFIDEMISGRPREDLLRESLFSKDEQCARVLARALSRELDYQPICSHDLNDQMKEELNARYENAVESWISGHPFLKKEEDRVHNAVFAAVAVMHCVFSDIPAYREIAYQYASDNRPTYHLLHIVQQASQERTISARAFNMLIQSCSERLRVGADIRIAISGQSWEDSPLPNGQYENTAELIIDMTFGSGEEDGFSFEGILESDGITLGPYLINTQVVLPCTVRLSSRLPIVVMGKCSISALDVSVSTSDLSVQGIPWKAVGSDNEETELFIDARNIRGHAEKVSGATTHIMIQSVTHELAFPLARYFRNRGTPFGELADEVLMERFFRLKRILMEFVSRVKLRQKIENRRVLRNDVSDAGERVLQGLDDKEILRLDGSFYRLDTDRSSQVLGVSWQQLREGRTSPELIAFLASL